MRKLFLSFFLLLITVLLQADENAPVSIFVFPNVLYKAIQQNGSDHKADDLYISSIMREANDHTVSDTYITLAKSIGINPMVFAPGEMIFEQPNENLTGCLPINGCSLKVITEFGGKIPDIDTDLIHLGIDFESDSETAISIGKGIVDKVEYSAMDLGMHVYIYHGRGIYSVYGHLGKAAVYEGQIVEARQLIGTIGASGLTAYKCLHFAIFTSDFGSKFIERRVYYNPILLFPAFTQHD